MLFEQQFQGRTHSIDIDGTATDIIELAQRVLSQHARCRPLVGDWALGFDGNTQGIHAEG